MRFRAPASVMLRRAQLILMLAALVPTVLITGVGIVLLAIGSSSGAIVAGVLVLAFCATAVTGFILTYIFVSRGANLSRMQDDFLSSVSHELRTPLTSMQVFIETLKEGRVTDPAEQRKCLDVVHQELRRLDGLVTRLLELSRIQDGPSAFDHKPILVNEVVDDAVAAFRAAALGVSVDLKVAAEPGLWVVGDRSALARAVGNLLTNAWKYGPPVDAWIALSARLMGNWVEIAVADNGQGIPVEERARVFEHFQRGRAAIDGRKPGVGLGLAIVRSVVKAHRGRIELGSAGQGGARFAILLPRMKAAGAAT